MADFVKVCSITDVKPGQAKRFKAGTEEVALFNISGKFYAIGAVCSHSGGPLEEGSVDGDSSEVECPWHGARFDLNSGRATAPPAPTGVKKYEVKVEGNDVLVKG